VRWSALAEHLADSRASAFTNHAPAAAPERARLPPRSPLAVAARAARWHRAYSIVDCCFACRCSFHESIAPEVAVEVEGDISDAEHCSGAWNSRARERDKEKEITVMHGGATRSHTSWSHQMTARWYSGRAGSSFRRWHNYTPRLLVVVYRPPADWLHNRLRIP